MLLGKMAALLTGLGVMVAVFMFFEITVEISPRYRSPAEDSSSSSLSLSSANLSIYAKANADSLSTSPTNRKNRKEISESTFAVVKSTDLSSPSGGLLIDPIKNSKRSALRNESLQLASTDERTKRKDMSEAIATAFSILGNLSSPSRSNAKRMAVRRQNPKSADDSAKSAISPSKTTHVEDPRPRGLRLFMVGDSLSRYHYMSMTYFLTHSKWIHKDLQQYNPINEKTYQNWEEYFTLGTSEYELCDCYREVNYTEIVENRYFYEPSRDNMVVYVQMLEEMRGRVPPESAVQQIQGFQYKFYKDTNWLWKTTDWAHLIRTHAANMQPKPTHALLNGGIWGEQFSGANARQNLIDALDEANITGIWRTTTAPRSKTRSPECLEENKLVSNDFIKTNHHQVLDVEWTYELPRSMYWNDNHPWEPVYRVMTEQFFEGNLGHRFPSDYQKADKAAMLGSAEETIPTARLPNGLRLAFLGDSICRFQYLSLAYFLTHGKWYNVNSKVSLVSEMGYNGDWERFFEFTNKQMNRGELCDCYRGNTTDLSKHVENRFYYMDKTDNAVSYIRHYGDNTVLFQGRVVPPPFSPDRKSIFAYIPDSNVSTWQWQYIDYNQVIRDLFSLFQPKPTHIVFNAGINPRGWEIGGRLIIEALRQENVTGIWRTTTFRRTHGREEVVLRVDQMMGDLFRQHGHLVLNTTWTKGLLPEFYWTPNLFYEPVYRSINEELLEGLLGYTFPYDEPFHYKKVDRAELVLYRKVII